MYLDTLGLLQYVYYPSDKQLYFELANIHWTYIHINSTQNKNTHEYCTANVGYSSPSENSVQIEILKEKRKEFIKTISAQYILFWSN